LEIYRTLVKTNPDAYLSEMAMTLNSLGIVYRVNNAHTKAQSAYEEALGFFVSVLCFCVCIVVTVKQAKTVECHCHLR
jgi:hypothetical protein